MAIEDLKIWEIYSWKPKFHKKSDSKFNPFFVPNKDEKIVTAPTVTPKSTQKLITDFAKPLVKLTKSTLANIPRCTSLPNLSENSDTSEKKFKHLFIKKNDRGFNFCNNVTCRYCPLMNKTGTIVCSYTKQEYS